MDEKPQHRRLANAEIGVDTEHLGDIIQSAYMQTVFDVTKGTDYRAAFDLIPESRVKAILSTNWSGQMFSERVWDNTNALADGLKHDMLVGIMAGKSEQHMADDIMSRCGVGAFEARRLVRTETTCVANMAELYGYKELDIDEYEFSACLDSRTSDLCRELDGKVFKRNSAQAGVNLPPMHPFCRSTTLPVLPSEEDLDKELAELGDEIGADVDFDEWERNLQQGEDGKWRYVAGSVAKRFAELGYDTVLISQYGGCSETCEPYQGKVYIDDVFTIWNGERSGDFGKSNYCDKWFMLLSVAIRGGLFHPNCRHTMGQYIEGLTKIPQPIPAEKIREQRALEEKQRAMERKIRALKRKVEGTQDEKKVKEYKRKLREEQGKLREFIKEHDDVLRRDYSREKIYSGKGEPKQTAPRTEEAPVKATDTESKNPVPTDKEPNIPKPDNNVSEPENNVSKSENNENTMNFVRPEPVKTVKSNEETDDAPTAVVSDEAVETAKTTESIQKTVKQPIETATDSEEDVQNFTDDTVDNSDESDIIEEDNIDHFIGDNTTEPYKYEYSFEPKVTAEVREAFNEEYQKAVEMYGEIDTVSGVNVLTVVSKDEGLYNDNSQRISLRHAEKKNGLKIMASVAQEKYKAGKWSTGHPRHAMRHEIGHAIQLHHRLYDKDWNDKRLKISLIFKKAFLNEDGFSMPSSYICDDIDEFISECVAASYLNPKKQSKTIKTVYRIITGGV